MPWAKISARQMVCPKFFDSPLETSFWHYRSHQLAYNDWMGVSLDGMLWVAGITASLLQNRFFGHLDLIYDTLIAATCFAVAFASLRRPNWYAPRRRTIARLWRLSVLLWPATMNVMARERIPIAERSAIALFVFGSSFLLNITPAIVLPLPMAESMAISVLTTLRLLHVQHDVCAAGTLWADPSSMASGIWAVLAGVTPIGIVAPTMRDNLHHVLSREARCALVYATAELGVLVALGWAVRALEVKARQRFLRAAAARAGEVEWAAGCGPREEEAMSEVDPVRGAIRAACLAICAAAAMWSAAIIFTGTVMEAEL